MKSLSVLFFILFASFGAHAAKFGIQPGMYKTETKMYLDGKPYDPMAAFKKQMQNLPPETRKQAMKSFKGMGSQDGSQCVTSKMLSGKYFMENMKGNEDCNFKLKKMTASLMSGTLKCKDQKGQGHIKTKKINSKQYESVFVTDQTVEGKKFKIISKGKLISAKCTKR